MALRLWKVGGSPVAIETQLPGPALPLGTQEDKHIVAQAKGRKVVYQDLDTADLGMAGLATDRSGMVDLATVIELVVD
jgi:hypothetical protein